MLRLDIKKSFIELLKKIVNKKAEMEIGLFKKLHSKLPLELIAAYCNAYGKQYNYYTTMNCRARDSSQMFFKDEFEGKNRDMVAIVLQGPPLFEDDFTYETIKLYKKMFNNVEIILSTWDNVSNDYVDSIKALGCYVLLNKQPKKSGIGNVNYQIISSFEGIKTAEKLGCKYVMKTRTDQRLYKQNVCDFLVSLVHTFPSDNTNQKSRIVISQGSTGCMFLPYYISDFFYFGTIEDMKKIFETEQNEKDFANRRQIDEYDKEIGKKYNFSRTLHFCAPQNYIMESYAEAINHEVRGEICDYWAFVKKSLIGVSVTQLGLFWKKYTSTIFDNSWCHDFAFDDSEKQLHTYNWTFDNWFNLYTGRINYLESYEQIKERREK